MAFGNGSVARFRNCPAAASKTAASLVINGKRLGVAAYGHVANERLSGNRGKDLLLTKVAQARDDRLEPKLAT
ncbi:hypothetical protein IVB33_25155 [Bradyrhizobium sp. 24]|nr:hypothetical protein [Bradyrhizobium sp. 24]